MRFHARLLLGVCGLAFAVPAAAVAGPQDEGAAVAAQQGHTHKGLFGRRHCIECQRARVKAHDGVDVPAPPPLEPGVIVSNQPGRCATCEGAVVVSGPMTDSGAHAPGYAVVGGPADGSGYAVLGESATGAEPAPIGSSRSRLGLPADPRMAAAGARPGAGPYDPSVVPTNLPPAQVAVASPEHDRPHIISHLLGLPIAGTRRREREEEERQKHASIAYDQPGQQVTELSASVVYGKNNK